MLVLFRAPTRVRGVVHWLRVPFMVSSETTTIIQRQCHFNGTDINASSSAECRFQWLNSLFCAHRAHNAPFCVDEGSHNSSRKLTQLLYLRQPFSPSPAEVLDLESGQCGLCAKGRTAVEFAVPSSDGFSSRWLSWGMESVHASLGEMWSFFFASHSSGGIPSSIHLLVFLFFILRKCSQKCRSSNYG